MGTVLKARWGRPEPRRDWRERWRPSRGLASGAQGMGGGAGPGQRAVMSALGRGHRAVDFNFPDCTMGGRRGPRAPRGRGEKLGAEGVSPPPFLWTQLTPGGRRGWLPEPAPLPHFRRPEPASTRGICALFPRGSQAAPPHRQAQLGCPPRVWPRACHGQFLGAQQAGQVGWCRGLLLLGWAGEALPPGPGPIPGCPLLLAPPGSFGGPRALPGPGCLLDHWPVPLEQTVFWADPASLFSASGKWRTPHTRPTGDRTLAR